MAFITRYFPTTQLKTASKEKFDLKQHTSITSNYINGTPSFTNKNAGIPFSFDRSISVSHSTLGSAARLQATSMRVATASVASSALSTNRNGPHIFSLLLAFVAGGLFFSSVIAAMTASYAIGMQNSALIWKKILYVLSKVWYSFSNSCRLAKEALLPQDVYHGNKNNTTESTVLDDDPDTQLPGKTVKTRWFWKRAYKVFMENLELTRLTASEGLQVMKMEADFFAAVVGVPGLLPLQYLVDRLYPYSLRTMLSDTIENSLKEVQNRQVRTLTLVDFQSGDTPPQLLGARAYNINATSNSTIPALAMDVDVSWKSSKDCVAKIDMILKGPGKVRIPIRLKNIQYEGVVRFIAAPLTSTLPGYGALLVSIPSLPNILNVDVIVAGGQITKVPWLRTELSSIIKKSIEESLFWPKRVVIPTMIASQPKKLLSDIELRELELSDPLLQAENELRERQSEKEYSFEKDVILTNITEQRLNISLLEDTKEITRIEINDAVKMRTTFSLWRQLSRVALPGRAPRKTLNETAQIVNH